MNAGDKFLELVKILDRLRAPDGCPWDREQTHESLKKYAIEESYELCDAVDSRDDNKIKEELGDVLLQVVFHAQIAKEEGRFEIGDAIDAVNQKMIARHPHVFGDDKADTAEEVLRRWEHAKLKEKAEGTSILAGVPKSIPALLKAHMIQQRVARVGFDWEKTEDVLAKVDEELAEFNEACRCKDSAAIEEELGDLLFAMVNVARWCDVDPENALARTVNKFVKRFHHIEKRVRESGKTLEEASLQEMDGYWEEAKSQSEVGDA